MLLNQEGLSTADYAVAVAAKTTEEETGEPAAAIELPDGRIVTGKNKALLGAASAMLLNALKAWRIFRMMNIYWHQKLFVRFRN